MCSSAGGDFLACVCVMISLFCFDGFASAVFIIFSSTVYKLLPMIHVFCSWQESKTWCHRRAHHSGGQERLCSMEHCALWKSKGPDPHRKHAAAKGHWPFVWPPIRAERHCLQVCLLWKPALHSSILWNVHSLSMICSRQASGLQYHLWLYSWWFGKVCGSDICVICSRPSARDFSSYCFHQLLILICFGVFLALVCVASFC